MMLEVAMRAGVLPDIPEIMAINEKWLLQNLEGSDNNNGFLTGEAIQAFDLKKIIHSNELVVAVYKEKVVGYYLLDNYSHSDFTRVIDSFLRQQNGGEILPDNVRISKRAQVVIDQGWQNLGLSKPLFKLLISTIGSKYDLLFSTVSKLNRKLAAHKKVGWEVVGENEDLYVVQYRIVI